MINALLLHSGTALFYQPGLLYGGSVEHECNVQRSIGYYLEALLMLAPFMKVPLKAILKGVTNDPTDPSVSNLSYIEMGCPTIRLML